MYLKTERRILNLDRVDTIYLEEHESTRFDIILFSYGEEGYEITLEKGKGKEFLEKIAKELKAQNVSDIIKEI